MPKTRISCPNCRQPIPADIDQLVDVGHDPGLKQKFLAGMINYFECPSCHYQGTYSTLLVYHDPDKELLLHYVPPELGLPINEQERMIGSLINQVVNRLPQEKRKGYLLKPQQTLTIQGLVERVLEADGITREMIEAQQKKLTLIQNLLESTEDQRIEIIHREDEQINGEFFLILRRLIEASAINQDKETSQKLSEIQDALLNNSEYGLVLKERSSAVQEAIHQMQEIGNKLNRESLLDLCLNTDNVYKIQTYVSFARPLMDYSFFQLLSEKLDRSRGDGRTRLAELRSTLLELTAQYDKELENRRSEAREIIKQLVEVDDISQVIAQLAQHIDELFIQELEFVLEQARKQGDLEKINKLNEIREAIQEAAAPPAEVSLIEELISAENRDEMSRLLEKHSDEITPEFLEILGGFTTQIREEDNPELYRKINELNRMAVRFSMVRQLKK
jgi:hypothetical protein